MDERGEAGGNKPCSGDELDGSGGDKRVDWGVVSASVTSSVVSSK